MTENIDLQSIKTFIFDLGGVIVDLDRAACARAYENLGITNANDLLGNYGHEGVFLQIETGEITVDEFRNAIRHIAQKNITDEEINAAHSRFLLGIPDERKEMLLRLRKKHTVLALSNTSPIHLNYCVKPMLTDETHSPEDYFDKIHTSFDLKSVKPENKIFERMTALSNLKPQECLFFDDGLANIEAAKKLGFQTFHVTEENNWVEYLNEELNKI